MIPRKKPIPREDWERARLACGQAPSADACQRADTTTRRRNTKLSCKWTSVEKVVSEESVQIIDRPTYGCRPWNALDSRIDMRFKDDPAQMAWLPISLSWLIYVIAGLMVIITPIIAKGVIDLYLPIAALWFIVGIAVMARVNTYQGFIVGLVVFLFIDGVVDSFMTGGFQWIGPPFIIDSNWSIWYPYLIYLYLFSLWTGGFLARAYIASTKVTLNWFKVMGLTIGTWIISASGVSDYLNLGIRPKVPDFDTYFAPLGFWTWELFTVRCIIHIAIGIAIIYWTWRTPQKSILAMVGIIGVALVLSTYPFIMDLFI